MKIMHFVLALLLTFGVGLSNTASAVDFCWKSSYGRGVGTIPSDCSYNQEKQGLLCYPKCNAGYTGVAFVCWQDCPTGFRDDGAFCAKPAPYGRGWGYPWQFGDPLDDSGMYARCQRDNGAGNCEKWGLVVYPKCKAGFHNVGSNVCSPDCPTGMPDIGVSCTKTSYTRATISASCPAGYVYDAGLCYQQCNGGYSGVGPVCWGRCEGATPLECGAGCASTADVCAKQIADQVLSVLETAANIALTVATAGGSTAATAAAKSAQAGVKAGSKLGMAAAGKALGNMTKTTFVSTAKKKMLELGKDVAEETLSAWGEALVVSGTQNAAAVATGEAPSFEWESLDPTGIATIVKAYNHPVCGAPTSTVKDTETAAIPLMTDNRPPPTAWAKVTGNARDIAVGTDATMWVIDVNGYIQRKRITDAAWSVVANGMGTRIAALDASRAWVVNAAGNIFKYNAKSNAWEVLPGYATDIAVDSNETLWAIGPKGNLPQYGGSIWRLSAGATVWERLPGIAIAIGAGMPDQAWVVNGEGKPFKWTGTGWEVAILPNGHIARDVSVGQDNSVYAATGPNVYRRAPGATAWTLMPGGIQAISSRSLNSAFGVDPNTTIWKWDS